MQSAASFIMCEQPSHLDVEDFDNSRTNLLFLDEREISQQIRAQLTCCFSLSSNISNEPIQKSSASQAKTTHKTRQMPIRAGYERSPLSVQIGWGTCYVQETKELVHSFPTDQQDAM